MKNSAITRAPSLLSPRSRLRMRYGSSTIRTWPRAAATRSSRILKPRPYNLRTTRSRNPRRTTKKPLIGSVRPLQMTLLSALAARLTRTRSAASAPVLPPCMYRLATTMSAASRFAASSSFGTSVSSCCRSASITARYGAELASIPSMHAEARPRLPMRWRQRTRRSCWARSRTRSSEPSKASSTTMIVSQSSPVSACSSACSSAGMLSRSRNAGTTTDSSGICRPGVDVPAQQAQQERGEHDLHSTHHQGRCRNGVAHHDPWIQCAEAGFAPLPESRTAPKQPAKRHPQAEQQAPLERKDPEQSVEGRSSRQQTAVLRRHASEQGKQTKLHAEERCGRRVQHAVNIQPRAEETQRREIERGGQSNAHAEQCKAGIEKQPARTEEKKEPKMPPAIAPAAQMRRSSTPVRMQDDRHFRDAPSRERCLHDELARELHSGRPQMKRCNRFAIKAAQPAVEIADLGAKQQLADEAQHRVAEVSVKQRHGAFADAAAKAVAHHQRIAFAQLAYEGIEAAEVVAVVRIAHDDVAAARGGDASCQRRTVAAPGDFDNAGPGTLRHEPRAVDRSVVGDQHFSINPRALEKATRLGDAQRDRRGLVEARHEDRQLGHPFCSPAKKRYPEGYLFPETKLGD